MMTACRWRSPIYIVDHPAAIMVVVKRIIKGYNSRDRKNQEGERGKRGKKRERKK
jgi:hypothetical protein